jgi:hypothetical protein
VGTRRREERGEMRGRRVKVKEKASIARSIGRTAEERHRIFYLRAI